MTFAPPTLLAARRLLLDHLDIHDVGSWPADLDPAEVGIVGDTAHVATGTSYHLGKDQLRWSDAYSRRTARDIAGLSNAAAAVDVGQFSIITARGTFTHRSLAVWMVAQCRANVPGTRDIREVIYSPDGVNVLHYDRELGVASVPHSHTPDSHRWHDHFSCYRDAEFRYSLRDLFARWLTEIGLIGDDMTPQEVALAVWGYKGTYGGVPVLGDAYRRLNEIHAATFASAAATTAKLSAILVAALDDGNTTVVLPPDAIAQLTEIRDAIAAVPGAVADEEAARLAG